LAEAWLGAWKTVDAAHLNPFAPLHLLDYVHDFSGCSGQLAAEYADSIKTGFPYYAHLYEIRDSPAQPLSPTQRDQQATQALNGGSLAMFLFATGSGRYNPGAYFQTNRGWSPSTLAANYNQTPVIIGASCLANGVDATYLQYGAPSSKQMLLSYGRGASAFVGPTRGTSQVANYHIIQAIKQVWLSRPGLPLGRVMAVALNQVARQFPSDAEICREYVLLGDPQIVLPQPAFPVVGATGNLSGQVQLRAWPNPVRGALSVSFTVPHFGPVSVRAYDVAGRLTATIVEKVYPVGQYRVTWPTEKVRGVQFLELRVGSTVRHLKVVTVP
jgi:hypothetical protein